MGPLRSYSRGLSSSPQLRGSGCIASVQLPRVVSRRLQPGVELWKVYPLWFSFGASDPQLEAWRAARDNSWQEGVSCSSVPDLLAPLPNGGCYFCAPSVLWNSWSSATHL